MGCVCSGNSADDNKRLLLDRSDREQLDPEGSWRSLGFEQDDSHPVVCVTWHDAQDYVVWLSQRTGHHYRLLTEAEWEYAARAGSTTPFRWGNSASHDYANYGAEGFKPLAIAADRWEYTSPVGSFPPNAFGLYDMPGNALQWVQDCYASYDHLRSDGSAYETDIELKTGVPFSYMIGTHSCGYRMLRGGDWGDPPRMMRSAFRNFGPGPGATLQDYRSGGVGFRVARKLEPPRVSERIVKGMPEGGQSLPSSKQSAEAIRTAATRAITLVQASQKAWRVDCRSCHHQYRPALAFREARAHGLVVDESIARRDAIKAFNWQDIDAAVQFRNVVETSMDLAYAFVAADATGLQPNLAMQVYARMIAARQQPAGDWEDHHDRPPQSYSRFVQTAMAVRAIQLYSHPSQRRDVEARVSRALEWMRRNEPHDTADRTWQLIGLTWADRSGVATTFRAAQARALVDQQQADGGWGWKVGRQSDAYSTAEALVALHECGGVSVKSLIWRHGIKFLIRTQQTDGSWRVATRLHSTAVVSPPYFDSGYPYGHDQYLSMTAAGLAIEALAISLDFQQSARNASWKQEMPNAEPWVEAVLFGSAAELKALLDGGFDPNSATKSGGTTALMMAALDPEKIRLLVDRGANVNARAASGYSALMVAVQGREAAASVKLLLARGAETRSPDGLPKRIPSPMMLAVTIGTAEVFRDLRDARDSFDGMLPVAARNGLRGAVSTLLDLGAGIDEPCDRDGTTALERAVLGNDLDLAKSLIARGANVNHVGDRFKFTPLHHAASVDYGDSAMVELLLKSGAQPDLVTRDGETALDLARKFGHKHLIASLQRVSLGRASQ